MASLRTSSSASHAASDGSGARSTREHNHHSGARLGMVVQEPAARDDERRGIVVEVGEAVGRLGHQRAVVVAVAGDGAEAFEGLHGLDATARSARTDVPHAGSRGEQFSTVAVDERTPERVELREARCQAPSTSGRPRTLSEPARARPARARCPRGSDGRAGRRARWRAPASAPVSAPANGPRLGRATGADLVASTSQPSRAAHTSCSTSDPLTRVRRPGRQGPRGGIGSVDPRHGEELGHSGGCYRRPYHRPGWEPLRRRGAAPPPAVARCRG